MIDPELVEANPGTEVQNKVHTADQKHGDIGSAAGKVIALSEMLAGIDDEEKSKVIVEQARGSR